MTENESLPYFGHLCETKRTDSPWPLSCAVLITTKRLFAIWQYLEKLAAYSGTERLEGDGDLPQSKQIEDSQV